MRAGQGRAEGGAWNFYIVHAAPAGARARSASSKSATCKPGFPTGRKVRADFVKFFPSGRKRDKISLDRTPGLCISLEE